jgi:hypothetical protein
MVAGSRSGLPARANGIGAQTSMTVAGTSAQMHGAPETFVFATSDQPGFEQVAQACEFVAELCIRFNGADLSTIDGFRYILRLWGIC